MKRQWIKLQTDTLKDEKVTFIIRRYGWDCWGVFSGLMLGCDEGVLELPEEVFADSLFIEEKRFAEIISILEKYGFVVRTAEGKIALKNWGKYQSSLDELDQQREKERVRKAEYRKSTKEPVPDLSQDCPTNVPEVSHQSPALELEIELEEEKEINTGASAAASVPVSVENFQKKNLQKSKKHRYGLFQNVFLTEEERKRLEKDFQNSSELIDHLSNYRKRKGYPAKDDNLVIRDWVVRAVEDRKIKDEERRAKGAKLGMPPPGPAPEKKPIFYRCQNCSNEWTGEPECPKCGARNYALFKKGA